MTELYDDAVNQSESSFICRYLGLYAISFLVLWGIAAAVVIFFNINPPNITGVGLSALAALLPRILFLKDHGRPPNKAERRKFGLYASLFIIIFLFIFIIGAGIIIGPVNSEKLIHAFHYLSKWIWLAILIVSFFIQYIVASWAFGSIGGKRSTDLDDFD